MPLAFAAACAQATVIDFASRFGDDTVRINAMALDNAGNRYLVGSAVQSEPVPPATQSLGEQVFYAKVSAAGELVFSGRLGGFGSDHANAVAVDINGRMFIVGDTDSAALNSPVSPLQGSYGGEQDGFLAIIAANGSVQSVSYLGGSEIDSARAVTLGVDGNIYVAGSTVSDDFPGLGGDVFQPAFNRSDLNVGGCEEAGCGDGFVLKLTPEGTGYVYGTYFGGLNVDAINGIAVDESGNAFIAGVTASDANSFPLVVDADPPPVQSTLGNSGSTTAARGEPSDAFVAKLSADGAALIYSTYLGGGGIDGANAIALRDNGEAYVTGYTASNALRFPDGTTTRGFPVSVSAWQDHNNSGVFDAFVTRLTDDGTALRWSTYFGGPERDEARSISVLSNGGVVIGGITGVDTIPPRTGPCSNRPGNCLPLLRSLQFEGLGSSDGFVAGFDLGGELRFSTFLGGSGDDTVSAVVLRDGQVEIAGTSGSADFPAVGTPLQEESGAGFLTVLDTSLADDQLPDIRVDVGAVNVNELGEAFPVQQNEIARFQVSALNEGPGDASGVVLMLRATNATLVTPLPAVCTALDQVSAICHIDDPEAGEPIEVPTNPRSIGTARLEAVLLRADQSDRDTINNDDVQSITIVDTSGSRGSLDWTVLLALSVLLVLAGARRPRLPRRAMDG